MMRGDNSPEPKDEERRMTTRGSKLNAFASKIISGALPLLFIGGLISMNACSPDDVPTTPEAACDFDDDCKLGEVCLADGVCGSVSCDFCINDQICYTDADGNQSCSRPECATDNDCTGDLSCSDGLCVESSCTSRADCPEGQICNIVAGRCVAPPETCTLDTDCPAGKVCAADGSCITGCANNDECEAGTFCNMDTRICDPGCRADEDCSEDQTCNDENVCVCDPNKCQVGEVCDSDNIACIENVVESCDDLDCPDGSVCNPDTLTCEDEMRCTPEPDQPNSCGAGAACNEATGVCEIVNDACGPDDPTAEICAMTTNPYLNKDFCACVGCLEDSQCDVAAGEGCNSNGQCSICVVECDPGIPGACTGDTPICSLGCCVGCETNNDCADGNICLGGACEPPPSCTQDPTACPPGYECVDGTCSTPQGMQCDVNDPLSCGGLQQCVNGVCTGGGGFGSCDAATCPSGSCGMLGCSCDLLAGVGCPSGQQCLPFLNECLAL